ncbi:T9SS type A sorting domain-containing protein [candidate division WOR-3 bacterium]|nr:T9SS type A sorting domain-containing protein [candidate division WOR-3 bacterium]
MKEGCKKVLFTVAVVMFLLGSNLYAQAPDTLWTKTYGGPFPDYAGEVELTSDGGYIIAGLASLGAGMGDCYIVKTDSLGDTLWTKTYGDTNYDWCYSIQQCEDLGYIISGATWSFSADSQDLYLIKTDAIGDTIWTRIYGGIGEEFGASVRQTIDGGYIVVGKTTSYGAGMEDVWLLKTDEFGNIEWTQTYGGAGPDIGVSVQQTTDSGYVIAGYTASVDSFDSFNVYLLKTDENGDTLWTRTIGADRHDIGTTVQQTADGGFILAGYTYSYGSGLTDIYLIKLDSSGDTIWTKTYGGSEEDHAYSVQETSNGEFIIAGVTSSYGVGGADVFIVRTDEDGIIKWTKTIGGTSADMGYSVRETTDGGFVIAGWTRTFGLGMEDYYLIRLAPDVGIDEGENEVQIRKERLTVSSNPFAIATRIQLLDACKGKEIILTVYDASGRLVKSVKLTTSTYQLGADLVSGIYFLKFAIGEHKEIQKLIKIK